MDIGVERAELYDNIIFVEFGLLLTGLVGPSRVDRVHVTCID